MSRALKTEEQSYDPEPQLRDVQRGFLQDPKRTYRLGTAKFNPPTEKLIPNQSVLPLTDRT